MVFDLVECMSRCRLLYVGNLIVIILNVDLFFFSVVLIFVCFNMLVFIKVFFLIFIV